MILEAGKATSGQLLVRAYVTSTHGRNWGGKWACEKEATQEGLPHFKATHCLGKLT